jgi:two-component system, chemotaxis family, response regulator WspR
MISAETVKDSFRRSVDLAARFGGEEFVVILPLTTADELRLLAQKVVKAVADLNLPHAASTASDRVTISVGGATTVPELGKTFLALIGAADKALYQAKKSGRNRAVTGA